MTIVVRVIAQGILLALFGFVLPYLRGFSFFDTKLLLIFALAAIVLAVPDLTQALGRLGPNLDFPLLLRETGRAALVASALSLGSLAAGLVVVNVTRGVSPWVFPNAGPLAWIAVLAVTLSLTACAAVAATVAHTGNIRAGQRIIRVLLIALLSAYVAASQVTDPDWRDRLENLYTTPGLRGLALASLAVGIPAIGGLLWYSRKRLR